ncbi:MAG: hypothetical protein IIB60_00175 [Planctomycetes bacterium]|nr:hypothetical protein [Planctomycetota bacterium]
MVDTPSSPESHRLSVRKRLLFVFILLLAGMGLAEFGARVVDATTGISVDEHRTRYRTRRAHRLELAWQSQRSDYPYLPFIPNPEDHRVNELGFRGEEITRRKPPDTYRIVCLGGSTTWDGYPALLQDELHDDFARRGLDLEVINAGNICWTSMESVINFITRCLPLGPDAIIVYKAVNDAVPAFGDAHSPDYSHWRGRLEKNTPLFWDKLPLWLDASAAYVGFRAVFERKVATVDFGAMVSKYRVDFEKDRYHGMEPFRQNLYTLISVARARRIESFLCTFVFNDDYEFKHSLKRWSDAVADANEITRWYTDRWDDVHLIDTAAALKGGNDWMSDFCHFTPQGQVTFVRYIADGIRPHIDRLIQRRGDPLDIAAFVPHGQPTLAGGLLSPRHGNRATPHSPD